ncbi:hypothetical protein CBR_g30154 [Chara braunii]|uniref:Ammonium transporter AmtB-like domain-containing protein n=1 Tax=Chara braunii TaxID=69332 RepID=A0A388LC54_CHABU|nr:hypothetical protein CBR_g30154 [Chara braunii]|eukprot:GBG79889.1 hypothetical protein CBR_g30154 [Chara braunii]
MIISKGTSPKEDLGSTFVILNPVEGLVPQGQNSDPPSKGKLFHPDNGDVPADEGDMIISKGTNPKEDLGSTIVILNPFEGLVPQGQNSDPPSKGKLFHPENGVAPCSEGKLQLGLPPSSPSSHYVFVGKEARKKQLEHNNSKTDADFSKVVHSPRDDKDLEHCSDYDSSDSEEKDCIRVQELKDVEYMGCPEEEQRKDDNQSDPDVEILDFAVAGLFEEGAILFDPRKDSEALVMCTPSKRSRSNDNISVPTVQEQYLGEPSGSVLPDRPASKKRGHNTRAAKKSLAQASLHVGSVRTRNSALLPTCRPFNMDDCMSAIGAPLNIAGWPVGFNTTAFSEAICNSGVQAAAGAVTGANDTFLIFSAFLVFLMQAGFAMLCAGSVRSKNTINILLKNLLDACVGAIAWYATGYAFAFGEDNKNGFIGSNFFVMDGVATANDGAPKYIFWLFQWAFSAASATIVSGSVAERTSFVSYLGYSFFLTGLVYPVVVHWVWNSQGWLSALKASPFRGVGAIDFAGSGVVHMVGGVAGFWGAVIVGPRIGRFDRRGAATEMRGHSATLVVLGTFLLWFGWYGFNPGSMLAIVGSAGVVGRVAVTTTLAAASAGLSSLFLKKLTSGTWDAMAVCNGALGGLVSITAGCSVVEPWAAIVIGVIGGVVYLAGSALLLLIKVDDPVDAAPLHGGCGLWGVAAVGLFAKRSYVMDSIVSNATHYGLFHGGGGKMLGVQLLYAICIIAWVSGTMSLFFGVLKIFGVLRVPPEEEQRGLDLTKHGGTAYEAGVDLRAITPSDILKKDRSNVPLTPV